MCRASKKKTKNVTWKNYKEKFHIIVVEKGSCKLRPVC